MSYCVNCGVELDKTAKACALCGTPVVHPGRLEDTVSLPPFPREKGQVERMERKDLGILLTTVALGTSVACGLLNAFVFPGNLWSLAVIGICATLWVIMVPFVIYTGQSVCLSLFCDGAVAAFFLFLLTFLTDTDRWFWGLSLPLVVYVTLMVELTALCIQKLPRSFLTVGIYVITAIGLLCGGVEVLADNYLAGDIRLGWSAVALSACAIIDIALITMLSLRRLRLAVRRRLHF